jgi:hypothetical protein
MYPYRGTFAAAVLIVALSAGRGQASLIPWSYQWNAAPIVVNADPPGPHSASTGGINLIPSAITVNGGGPGVALGNSSIVAVNLTTFSFSPSSTGAPDRFNNTPYNLSVTLTDVNSQASKTLSFSAVFNGTLSDSSANILTTFTSPTTRSAMIGGNLYTVALNSYTPPGPPSADNEGTIGAFVSVDPHGAPEPSSLLLAVAGLGGIFCVWMRRRSSPALCPSRR